MATFADTSGLYAAFNPSDQNHLAALDAWTSLASRTEVLITTNYVVLEAISLVARRMGFQAVRAMQTDVVPLLQIHWVDAELHARAMAALLTAGERDLSLVDCVSFTVMRQFGLDTAFAFDDHFVRQGFRRIP